MISPNLLSISTDTAHIPVRSVIPLFPGEIQKQTLIPDGMKKITLRHHKRAFVGCFSLRLKKDIDWKLFKRWKVSRNPSLTEQIARDFLPFIKNYYDLITTAPPSANRCLHYYCVYDLAKAVSRMTEIPFIPAFAQKTDKVHHGRYASLSQSEPQLINSWNIQNKSILFIDDCITSGTTAYLCCKTLIRLGNHVDGLIWVTT